MTLLRAIVAVCATIVCAASTYTVANLASEWRNVPHTRTMVTFHTISQVALVALVWALAAYL